MVVYPAAGLVNYVPQHAQKYYIDPNANQFDAIKNLTAIRKKAGEAVPELVREFLNKK